MLGWKTAAEVWDQRPKLAHDRAALRQEVHERADRLRCHMSLDGLPNDLPVRLAIEQALTSHGYMACTNGARC